MIQAMVSAILAKSVRMKDTAAGTVKDIKLQ